MKKHKFVIIYSVVLVVFTGYMVLNTFVIPDASRVDTKAVNTSMFDGDTVKSLSEDNGIITDDSKLQEESGDTSEHPGRHGKHQRNNDDDGMTHEHHGNGADQTGGEKTSISSNSNEDGLLGTYESEEAKVSVSQYTYEDTKVYVADVILSSAQYIKTAFAQDTFGKNITETVSSMAENNDAVLAINGDNYGCQENGYVIRNGIIYRDKAGDEDLICIYADGSVGVVDPAEYTAEQLVENGVWQAFSFGPALIEDGILSVNEDDEVGRAKASNPRTAVGMIDDLHYVFVVSDGRTDSSEGLSLYELAGFMKDVGAVTAYNLDGGGSSTMIFNGDLINNPTTTGNNIKERKVNDIVYIG